MGRILVHGADLEGGRITRLQVKIPNLPPRVIDRATALGWMRDGHSLIPVRGDALQPALQLVQVGEEPFIRDDHAEEPADTVPELPPVAG